LNGEFDRVRMDVHLDSINLHMQSMICGALDDKKDEITALINESFENFDFHSYFQNELEKAIREKVSSIVKRAFSIPWEFERELELQVRGIMKARLEQEAKNNETDNKIST
jgi:hypothetical protein